MYEWLKRHKILVAVLAFFIMFGMPVIVWLLYDSLLWRCLENGLTAGDLLSYWGAALAFFATVALGILALYQNDQLKELNEHSNDTNDKLMDIERAGMKAYTGLESKECTFKKMSDVVPGYLPEPVIRLAKFRIRSVSGTSITLSNLETSYMIFDEFNGWYDWRKSRKSDASPHLFLGNTKPIVKKSDNEILDILFPILKWGEPFDGGNFKLCFKLTVTSIYGDRTSQFYQVDFKDNQITGWNTIVQTDDKNISSMIRDLYAFWVDKEKPFELKFIDFEGYETGQFDHRFEVDFFMSHFDFDKIQIQNSQKEQIEIQEEHFNSYTIKGSILRVKQWAADPLEINLNK